MIGVWRGRIDEESPTMPDRERLYLRTLAAVLRSTATAMLVGEIQSSSHKSDEMAFVPMRDEDGRFAGEISILVMDEGETVFIQESDHVHGSERKHGLVFVDYLPDVTFAPDHMAVSAWADSIDEIADALIDPASAELAEAVERRLEDYAVYAAAKASIDGLDFVTIQGAVPTRAHPTIAPMAPRRRKVVDDGIDHSAHPAWPVVVDVVMHMDGEDKFKFRPRGWTVDAAGDDVGILRTLSSYQRPIEDAPR